MGKPGPRPEPSNIVQLRGNPGKRTRPEEPKPAPVSSTEPPKEFDLSADAKKLWKRLAPELDRVGLLTTVDVMLLAELCEEWAMARAARRSVRRGTGYGVLTKDRTHGGEPRRHPGLLIARQHGAAVLAIAKEFGLSPSARVGLPAIPDDDADEDEDLFE